MSFNVERICCIGAGYVGGPTMSVIADKCPEIIVDVVDVNEERIAGWNDANLKNLPIYEPGLSEIIKRCRNKNLFFSSKVEEKIKSADIIFISVNTPTKKKGLGAGEASDLRYVEACARKVADFACNHTIVVEKSTLPVKTAEVIKKILEAKQVNNNSQDPPSSFDVLSNPEFLSEGSAIKDLTDPDRVLIGGENKAAIDVLDKIYQNWVPKNKILHTNIWSSELAKLTSNAFLAQRISSINAVGALCEATGADVREVSRAIGFDSRIGPKFLDASPGFGGSCFKKDILNLVYLAKYFGLPEVAKFWEEVVHLNNWHQGRISKVIAKKLFGTLTGKKIVILGFAFKANTNDTRESAAIQICKDLLEEGAQLIIHDPEVDSKQISIDLGVKQRDNNSQAFTEQYFEHGTWTMANDLETCFSNADAVVILTEWEIYKFIDWERITNTMREPAWLFDVRSLINPKDIENTKINFWRIGDGSINNKRI